MILKLEVMLKDMANDTKEIRREVRGVEELMSDNTQLKSQVSGYSSANNLETIKDFKSSIENMESKIEDLRNQISEQKPRRVNNEEFDMKRIDMEVHLEEVLSEVAAFEV